MSELAEFEGTSLTRPVAFSRPEETIRYGGIMDEQGTTSGLVWTLVVVHQPVHRLHRTAPVAVKPSEQNPARAALTELRERTGFTWEQVARVLDVTQRTPFLWSQGKPIAKSNEERLQRLVALIRRVERGTPDTTRAALLGARADGTVPFDLLAQGDFERAEGVLAVRPSTVPVSQVELQARLPASPVDRMLRSDAKVHVESGIVRKARSTRVKKRD